MWLEVVKSGCKWFKFVGFETVPSKFTPLYRTAKVSWQLADRQEPQRVPQMFRGSHATRVDEKGRLKLSTELKAVVDAEFGNEFFITSVDGKRAQLYPLKEWKKKEEQLNAIPASNPIRQRFLDVTSRFGQTVEMDGQGRLLLPQVLREEAGMVGDVTIIAKTSILEVALTSQFREEARPMTAEELAAAADLGL